MLPEPYATAIKALAAELADEVAEANAAAETLAAAEAHRAQITERVADLSVRREAIVTRRGAGNQQSQDGASLALLQADLEGLQPLMEEAAQRVTAAQRVHAGHSIHAARLREQIGHEEALAAREALIKYANDLSIRLLQTVTALDAACRQTGYQGPPIWGAPPVLYTELRRLAAGRGEL